MNTFIDMINFDTKSYVKNSIKSHPNKKKRIEQMLRSRNKPILTSLISNDEITLFMKATVILFSNCS